MKFGESYARAISNHPEWPVTTIVAYDKLKTMIKFLGELTSTQQVREAERRFVPPSLSFDPTGGAIDEKVPVTSPMLLSQHNTTPTTEGSGDVEAPLASSSSSTAAAEHEPIFVEITENDFFDEIDRSIAKLGAYTNARLEELNRDLMQLTTNVEHGWDTEEERVSFEEMAKAIGERFLSLESFINIQYTALYKILKKHDKYLPATPIYQFYRKRMYQQHWVQGDYSRMFVKLSAIHSTLRGDKAGVQDKGASQGFVRSTKKYWVKAEDVSSVKLALSQHLPVFQMKLDELRGDSQLTNSVYLDNQSLELYHGRLEKYPGAIAMRYRWYGDKEPEVVFVERKTHKESWKGELSVKERFTLMPEQVVPFSEGTYTVDMAVDDLLKRKPRTSAAELDDFRRLFTECQDQVVGKQLEPMMRTQYMRVAYQIPFDASVRVSLDTNLLMMKENPDCAPSCEEAGRWFRDPSLLVKRTEVTYFPHAVLEVKLSLAEGEECPRWVEDLVERSGYLTLVHKMSKFIHGCAVLLPDMVQSMPYWIDDLSLRPSILHSQPDRALTPRGGHVPRSGPSRGSSVDNASVVDDDHQQRPMLSGPRAILLPPTTNLAGVPYTDSTKFCAEEMASLLNTAGGLNPPPRPPGRGIWDRTMHALGLRKPTSRTVQPYMLPRKIPMRIEPKTFLANERTFLNWLNMAVHLGAIGTALVGFSIGLSTTEANQSLARPVQLVAVFVMPVSVVICLYASWVFFHRADRIRKREGSFDDRIGPPVLALIVVIALWGTFIAAVAQVASGG